mmetsp:Transcript_12585/g.18251  ORF Transcript_12585/g.18251 Transcript_12585/m.18251 type:complete len:82 (+) Transcript_12585:106-351(+)
MWPGQCRICAENPLATLFGPPDQPPTATKEAEKKQKKKSSKKASARNEASFQPRTEEEIIELFKGVISGKYEGQDPVHICD